MRARCCVLIPYFNAGSQLITSLASVDGLLEGRVDALVVDDGSTEVPAGTVLGGTAFSERVDVLALPENRGIAEALNAGMRVLLDEYEFIARLDCGDTCTNDRVQAQMDFLDRNPRCAMVGTWTAFYSPEGTYLYTVRPPVDHRSIMRRMRVNFAFIHPSVMFRTRLIRPLGLYPTDRDAAEDHAYFFRIGAHHETANIGEVHLHALIDPRGISNRRRRQQLLSRRAVLLDHLDFRPISLYGVLRATLQLATPREFTVLIRRTVHRRVRETHGLGR